MNALHEPTAAQPQRYAGKPCAACGGTARYASNRTCVACAAHKGAGNRDRRGTNNGALSAINRNTYLMLFAPDQFDREGWGWHDRAQTL